ncbi:MULTISPECIES: hypothetical protein [Alicyclobacillus]|uniref:Uncharacterized protein n=1 Tax=Alicyclobacillus acidoterrestris (strain ATCC 49025 / DSM 3922 / CIP 106132 / NCIMB 13137 / GD3B) TaxID=1356854 RepID=T0CW99_ALIAG|nr:MULTISPECIES: hypothetical protein [Alicyclobacillus]EPZ41811.1 hypothetical protein N007_16610 [Alicyclobacillus acidoterrestris ATCC 49025]UNO49575.1 hypothetical protein K1I37_03240 [Alicyclobacillus acidoterrestris]
MKTNYKWLAAGVTFALLITTGCGAETANPPAKSTSGSSSANAANSTNVTNSTSDNSTASSNNGTGANAGNNTTNANSSTENSTYVSYTNSRYGFALRVPEQFVKQAPPADGDGQSWNSPDNAMQVRAYGQYNVNNDTVKSTLASLTTGKQATYQQTNQNWGVVSGTDGNQIFYDKVYVGATSVYILTMEYPASDKSQYASVVTNIANSFQPGSLK